MAAQSGRDGVEDVRTALLVLGMHRSGTSAFARLFSLLGADLPVNLLPARPDNPRGFWESSELAALHDEILTSAGTIWHDWTRFNPGWYTSPLTRTYRAKLLAYLERDFGASRFFVIKDPRICRLVRLWRETLEEFGASIKVVIPVRNPQEVAQSLRLRDGFAAHKSHLLWLRHTLAAIQDSKGLPRCVVSYDGLLRDWRDTIATISRRLQLSWPRYSPSMEAEIDAFLTHAERHHAVTDDAVLEHPALGAWVKRAYRTLLAMTEADEAPGAQAEVDDLLEELDEASAAFGPLLMEQEGALAALRASGDRLAREREQERGTLEEQLRHVAAEKRRWKLRAKRARAGLSEASRRLEDASRRLEDRERRLAGWQLHVRALSRELIALRHRRVVRILERFRPGPDLSPDVSGAFQGLLDDSRLFLGSLAGYRLQPSDDVRTAGGLTYSLRLDRGNLTGLMLAPIVDVPDGEGSLGLELSTPDGIPVARARIPLAGIEPERPACFAFPPVQSSRRDAVMKVEVRDATGPVRLFEWRRRRCFGLGRLAARPFCAFVFGATG